jgi:hypothetical protein
LEEYQELCREAKKSARRSSAFALGVGACITGLAFGDGGKWYWLAGALFSIYGGLWSLGDLHHHNLRIWLMFNQHRRSER